MFTSNKSFNAFDRSQKPHGFVSVNRVLKILLVCNNFQVVQSIICTIKVFVVYFQTTLDASIKGFPYYAVHSFACVLTIAHKINLQIVLCIFTGLQWSITRITSPSLAQLDRMGCGYAGAQKLSNLLKGGTVLKHLLGFGNFGGVKSSTSGDAAHVPKVAHLVQIFKVQNWFPRFHSLSPFKMNRSIA